MPSHFKIGSTTRSPYERAIELSDATGVPKPFEVVVAAFCRDCRRLEATLHQRFASFRAASNREFFQFAHADHAAEEFASAIAAYIQEIDPLGMNRILEAAKAEIEELRPSLEDARSKIHRLMDEAQTAIANRKSVEEKMRDLIHARPLADQVAYACLAWCEKHPGMPAFVFFKEQNEIIRRRDEELAKSASGPWPPVKDKPKPQKEGAASQAELPQKSPVLNPVTAILLGIIGLLLALNFTGFRI